METGQPRLGRCRALAEQLRGEYVHLADLPLRAVAAENRGRGENVNEH
jgi:hypothetical protein